MTEPSRETDPPDRTAAPTRRQFLVALGGTALAATAFGYRGDLRVSAQTAPENGAVSASLVEATTAVARAVYPSSVTVDESFIERRVLGRVEPEAGHLDELAATVEAVDDYASARFGGRLTELSPARRRQVLQSMGVTTVHPTPDGTTPERVRYYLVNDLLFALFTSPLSSDLTGIENPPGYPGGVEAYQRGPGGDDQ